MEVSILSVTWMHSQRAGPWPGQPRRLRAGRGAECVPRLGRKEILVQVLLGSVARPAVLLLAELCAAMLTLLDLL